MGDDFFGHAVKDQPAFQKAENDAARKGDRENSR
jgi:hypothetical protein